MSSEPYRPKNILLTGGAGFIGSHVVIRLVQQHPEYKVIVLDKLDYCASLHNLEAVRNAPNFKFIRGNICAEDLVNYVLVSEKIDTVMHFAAQTHVDMSFGNSFEFTKNNILGTHVLLESCKAVGGIKRFIHVSTDEVYGETSVGSETGNTEYNTLEPTNPYSATKAGAEMLVKAYGTSYGLPCITTRGNNVYGPHQYPEKLIPKFLLLLHQGRRLPVHGAGLAKRSYLYVEDVAKAFVQVLHRGVIGDVYNIGTQQEQTVLEVATALCQNFGLDPKEVIDHVEDRPFNDQRYFLDVGKLAEIGWVQETSFDKGLLKTIEWYKKRVLGTDYFPNVESALVAHPRAAPGEAALPPSPWVKEDSESLALPPSPTAAKSSAAANGELTEPQRKYLVFGKTGWIGGLVADLLRADKAEFEFASVRLEDRAGVAAELERTGATHVINAAGLTGRPNVDWCETHKEETIRVNVIGTLALADACKLKGVHCTIFATGCIYEYDAAHPEGSGRGFTEEEPPNFTGSFYSQTKAAVEALLKEYDNCLILRVRMPISGDLTNPRNFVTKISRYEKVVNIPNSMTVLDEMLPVALSLAKRSLTGIFNFCNPGVLSHNEVLELYKEYVDPSFTWTNFTLEEQAKVISAPRSNNELDAAKLLAAYPGILSLRDSLIKYVMEPNKGKIPPRS
mmetsp:Transcript_25198/g.82699  ORF Transcript_25198/g.82699 Transcript_25198/m.82699 type:complete len:678 (+) Transcript_25198:18-2051(+)